MNPTQKKVSSPMNCSRWMPAALAVLFASGAQAQGVSPGGSAGPFRSYIVTSVQLPHVSDKFGKISGGQLGRLIVGYQLVPNVEVEGMLATSLAMARLNSSDPVEVSHAFGIFVRPSLEIQPGLRAFARMGYVVPRIKFKNSPESESEVGKFFPRLMSLGLGASYQVTDRFALVGDYMRYLEFKSGWVGGLGIGVSYKF